MRSSCTQPRYRTGRDKTNAYCKRDTFYTSVALLSRPRKNCRATNEPVQTAVQPRAIVRSIAVRVCMRPAMAFYILPMLERH